MLALIPKLKQCLSGFPTISLLSFPSSHCALWNEVSMCSSDLKNRELHSTSLKGKYLQKLSGVLLYGRHTSSPLFAHSITCISMDSWIFYFILRFITQYYIIYFVAQIVCVFYTVLFLVLQHVPGSAHH